MKAPVLFTIFFFIMLFSRGQWSYTDLTEVKFRIGVTSLGTKAYFAGGESASGQVSAVEIYDVENDDWDTVIHLLMPRSHIACAASGTKVFFAGGIDFGSFNFFDIVDIWDTETRQWEYEQLIAPRFSISAVSYGNQVVFAGGVNMNLGQYYDLVEIYNTETGVWTTTSLSIPRSAMTAAVSGDLGFFAGGSDGQNVTDRVDIYNFNTHTWSIASLSEARAFPTATAVGTKVLFAGGTNADNESSDRVDIYDTETGIWDTASLSQPRAFWEGNSGTVCDERAYFVGGGIFDLITNTYGDPFNIIDIYNAEDDTWTTDITITPILGHAVIGVNDHLLVAGGMTNSGKISTVQIFTDANCLHPGVDHVLPVVSQQSAVNVYPNPTDGISHFEFRIAQYERVSLKIYDVNGKEVGTVLDEKMPAGEQTVSYDMSGLPSGIYFYRLTANGQLSAVGGKIVKY